MSLARERGMTAGGSVLFLTVLGTLSQLLGFGYRVALSRMVGAEVMGLYQLIMPVYSVLLSLTAVGLTAAVSNLTPQYLALGNSRGIPQLLGTCLKILFLLMVPISAVVLLCYDPISVYWLGDARTQLGLILLLPCVALTGVENLHKHFFYGSSLVRPPAVAELLEQLVRTGAVLGLLAYFLPQYPERVVGLIVAGMVICEVASAVTLTVLCRWRLHRMGLKGPGEPGRVRRRRVFSIALPVGLNALLGNLMGAVNAALVPQKLVEGGMEPSQAISELGVVCGMTLPMLALPTVFLSAMSLVLVPRLARSTALNRPQAVRDTVSKALSAVSVLALPAMGMMAVLGEELGVLLFRQEAVGEYLLPLAAATALSCYQAILGASLNGVGRQGTVAWISLVCDGVQLAFTACLVGVPSVGMGGLCGGDAGLHRPGAGFVRLAAARLHRTVLPPVPLGDRPGAGRSPVRPGHQPAVSGAPGQRRARPLAYPRRPGLRPGPLYRRPQRPGGAPAGAVPAGVRETPPIRAAFLCQENRNPCSCPSSSMDLNFST